MSHTYWLAAQEGLGPIITAIQASRTIFARLQSYLIYRIASSLLILGFFFFGIIILGLEMPTWAIIVINITNDASVMATSFDKVRPSAALLTELVIAFTICRHGSPKHAVKICPSVTAKKKSYIARLGDSGPPLHAYAMSIG